MAAFSAIHELEVVNFLLAVRHLIPDNCTYIVLLVNVDNTALTATLSSGQVDPTLGACARELAPRRPRVLHPQDPAQARHRGTSSLTPSAALTLPPLPLTLCMTCACRNP